MLSNPEFIGLREGENAETVFQDIIRTMSEVEDTDLIDMTEIRNNHPGCCHLLKFA